MWFSAISAGGSPKCKLFEAKSQHLEASLIFHGSHRSESMLWADLYFQIPDAFSHLSEVFVITFGDGMTYVIDGSFEKERINTISGRVDVLSLKINVVQQSAGKEDLCLT